MTVWFFVTYLPLDGVTPIRYLLVLYFLGITAMYYRDVVPVILKSWPLFLLPIFGLLSFMWSDYPSEAIRAGVLLLLTPLTIVVVGARLNTRQALRCLMFCRHDHNHLCHSNVQYVQPGRAIWQRCEEPVSQSRCCSRCSSAWPRRSIQKSFLWVRLLAIPFVPVCFVFSVYGAFGDVACFLPSSASSACSGCAIFWMGLGQIRHLRTSLLMASVGIALTGAIVFLSMPENTMMNDFLRLLGKDGTFSGRSAIWRQAELLSHEHPIAGVGLEGFWQYDVGAAQTINENDFKPFGTKLTFHNSFWEVRVHLGYIGYALFLLILGWCSYRTVSDVVQSTHNG